MLGGDEDTIAAISTAMGAGGIAVVRLSGPRAAEITRDVFRLPPTLESHRVYFGNLVDPEGSQVLDEVLVTYFQKGRSFTGDEVIEISCHGGVFLSGAILELLLRRGARLARRGEFTYRAVMNGRMDLVQAEGVLDLIESQNAQAHRRALRQLKGDLSRRFDEIKNLILNSAAHIEASLDFSEEDIDVGPANWIRDQISSALVRIESLLSTEKMSRIVRSGFQVAIVGEPNVGKSSLLNFLLGEQKAIVTDVAGTTRDVVDGEVRIEGYRVILKDTAGLRETEDKVEQIGIERAREAMNEADLIWLVCEGDSLASAVRELKQWPADLVRRSWILVNKIDLSEAETESGLGRFGQKIFPVSAKTGQGISDLKGALQDVLGHLFNDDSEVLIGQRQAEELRLAKERLEKAQALVGQNESLEFVAFELKEALVRIQEILGERFDDQIMDRVFESFCLGK